MKKLIFLSILIIASLAIFTTCASAETVFETEKRILCEEINNSRMVRSTCDGSFGNSVYSSVEAVIKDPAEIKEPLMSFKFNAPEDGTYAIYTHAIFPTDGSDSFFYKIDDMMWKDVHPNAKGQNMVWFAVGNVTLTAGEHTFYWHSREVGSTFDCFTISKCGDFKVIVAGETLVSDVAPYVENGISMIPFRALGEALGAEVSWDAEKLSATITTGKISLTIVQDSNTAYWANFPMKLDTPARIINGRFMVPVRFVADNLQYDITWAPGTNHAFITKK